MRSWEKKKRYPLDGGTWSFGVRAVGLSIRIARGCELLIGILVMG